MKPPVNIFTEWGPLKEVVVGDFFNFNIPASHDCHDLSFVSFYNDNIDASRDRSRKIKLIKDVSLHDIQIYPEQIQEQRDEDIENLCNVLSSYDIIVKRPDKLTELYEFTTPYWTNVSSPCGNVRDQFLVVGDTIIETSPMLRNRYFENDLLKTVLLDYFRNGANWICSPKPTMKHDGFDLSYIDSDYISPNPLLFEIMFDGAQCLKFGKDILFNISNKNHELGITWLKRQLEPTFRIHPVYITDNHLDGMLMPVRPGLLLMKEAMVEKRHLLPKPLQKWDYIIFSDYDLNDYKSDKLKWLLASMGINCNVLSISPDKVIINQMATNAIDMLYKYGIEPIPLQLRHSRLYAGAFHCSTLDIYRDEDCDDYFN